MMCRAVSVPSVGILFFGLINRRNTEECLYVVHPSKLGLELRPSVLKFLQAKALTVNKILHNKPQIFQNLYVCTKGRV